MPGTMGGRMSKLTRRILKTAGGCAAVAGIALGASAFYFTRPAVQKNFVLKTLEDRGIPAKIDSVRIGLGGTLALSGFSLDLPAGRVTCDSGEIDFSVLSLLQKRIEINSLTADGLSFDLTQQTPAGENAPEKDASAGAPQTQEKPAGLVFAIKDARLAGTAKLADGNEFSYTLKGIKIDSASGGEIFLDLKEKAAPERSLALNTAFVLRKKPASAPQTLDDLLAADPAFVLTGTLKNGAYGTLALTADGDSADGTKKWTARIATPAGKSVFETTGNATSGGLVDARLKIDLDTDMLPFLGDFRELPHVKIAGDATVKGGGSAPIAGKFSFAGDIRELARFAGKSGDIPAMKFELDADGSATRHTAALNKFSFALRDAANETLVALRTKKTLFAATAGGTPKLLDATGTLAVCTIGKLPAALANAFLPDPAKHLEIKTGTLDAELVLEAEDAENFRLISKQPVRLSDFSASSAGAPCVEKIDGTAPVIFRFGKNRRHFEILDIALTAAGGLPLLNATARAEAAGDGAVDFSMNAVARCDALAVQPAWEKILSGVAGQDWRIRFAAAGNAKDGLLLKTAEISAGKGDGPAHFTAKNLLPIDTANPGKNEGKPVARIDAAGIPLATATPFLAGATLDGTATGTVLLTKNPAGITVETQSGKPVSLRNVSFFDANKKPFLKDFSLDGNVAVNVATDNSKAWSINVADAKMNAGAGSALAGALAIKCDANGPEKLTADLAGDPSNLLRQPFLLGKDYVKSAELSLKGEYTRTGNCDVSLLLENVKTAENEPPAIKTLRASLLGNIGPKGGKLKMPVVLEGEKCSDLTADITVGETRKLNIDLRGDTLNADDFLKIAAALSGEKEPAPKKPETGEPATGPEAKPAHVASPGNTPARRTLELDLTAAVRQLLVSNLAFTDCAAEAHIDPTTAILSKLSANAAGGTVAGDARLDFNTAAPETPCRLAGKIDFENFDFEQVLRAGNPAATKVINGRFDTRVNFSAVAPTVEALSDKLDASLNFESRNGRVAIFKADNATVKTVGELSGLAGDVANILSGILGSGKSAKLTRPLRAFGEIRKYLEDFPYDEAVVRINRPAGGDLGITRLLLKNDQLRITGDGVIALGDGKAFRDAPMKISLTLAARGTLASNLKNLKMLKEEIRADDYTPGPAFTLGGSLNSMQNDLFSTLLRGVRDDVAPAKTPAAPGTENKDKVNNAIRDGANLLRGLVP